MLSSPRCLWEGWIKKLGVSVSLGGRDIDLRLREEEYGYSTGILRNQKTKWGGGKKVYMKIEFMLP